MLSGGGFPRASLCSLGRARETGVETSCVLPWLEALSSAISKLTRKPKHKVL